MKKLIILTSALALCMAAAGSSSPKAPSANDILESYQRSYRCEISRDYRSAIRALTPTLAAYPEDYTVNLRLGWLYYLHGNHSSSLANYNMARKTAPDSIEAKLGYLLPLIALNRHAEVETLAREILSVDPYNYYGSLRLANALRLQNKFSAAEEVLTRVLAIYPSDAKFLTEEVLLKIAQKQPAEASQLLTRLLQLDPTNAVAKTALKTLSKKN